MASKLEQLIQELCPDGVEYKTISDCVKKVDTIKWKNHPIEEYQYIDLTSVDRDTHFISETQTISKDNAPSRAQQIVRTNDILFGATRPMLKRYCIISEKYDGQICSTGFCVLRVAEDVVLARYLYHIVSSTDFFAHVEKHQKGASYPAISDADTKSYRFPAPPLEVQREIVRVLDNFTFLSAELSAELSARRKQYEYYRDSLLSFDTENKIEKIAVGDLFDFKNGINKEKSAFGSGIPIVNFTNVYNKNKLFRDDLQGRVQVSDEEAERYSAKKGDVFFTRTSETQEDIGITSVLLDDIDKCVFSGFVLRARPKTDLLLPEYCAYCFASAEARKYIVRHSTYTTRALTNGGTLSKMIISVPSKEVQRRIVDVLDNFESLCNDLGIGLPAEIDARQKQYEYYRDLLLTFAETGETILTDRQTDRQAEIALLQYVFGFANVTLGEIATITRGGNFQKKDFTDDGRPCIHYGQIYTRYGIAAEETISKLDENTFNKSKKAEAGDIVMAVTSENIEDVCKCTAWIGNEDIAVSGHTAIIRHNQNPKYLAYFFHTRMFFGQKRKLAHGTKVIEVTPDALKDIVIPLPSRDEQDRIVEQLDRFDGLCNDIEEGIPAEIEARQKQYEYYRDKLLTFSER